MNQIKQEIITVSCELIRKYLMETFTEERSIREPGAHFIWIREFCQEVNRNLNQIPGDKNEI